MIFISDILHITTYAVAIGGAIWLYAKIKKASAELSR